jgi:hypothetical protein
MNSRGSTSAPVADWQFFPNRKNPANRFIPQTAATIFGHIYAGNLAANRNFPDCPAFFGLQL